MSTEYSKEDVQHRLRNIQTAINLLTTTVNNPTAPTVKREAAEHRRRALTQEMQALSASFSRTENKA
jgi:hypothetical protein